MQEYINRIHGKLEKLLSIHPLESFRDGCLLAAPLEESEIKSLLRSNSLSTSEQILALYSWRNGVKSIDGKIGDAMIFAPYEFKKLQSSLNTRLKFLEEQENHYQDNFWNEGWLPFATDYMGSDLFFTLSADANSEIRLSSADTPGTPVVSENLESYLDFQLTAISEGAIFQSDDGYCDIDDQKFYQIGAEIFPDLEYWETMKGYTD